MNNTWKNISIGLFVVTAIAITISFILFLEPRVGDGAKKLEVRFSNISGIGEGTWVTFAGRAVGEVTKIAEVPAARQEVTDQFKRVYFYQLTLRIDSRVNVYTTDEITVQTTGLMGEKTVAIIPKAPPKGIASKIVTDQILYALSVDPLENALSQVSKVSKKIQTFVQNFDEWFEENNDDISRAVSAFGSAMDQLDHLLHSFNEQNVVHKVSDAIDAFKENLDFLADLLKEAQNHNIVAKTSFVLENFAEALEAFNVDGKQILRNTNSAMKDIAAGRGTIGKLIVSDEFYLRVSALISKANTLMNDLNHYGLLFQYDKSWQRGRTKRANILSALKTPEQFRNYFVREVDQINTALSRLSVLIEKVDSKEEKEKIMQSHPFKKDFMQLLLDVNALGETLKLYNEEMFDQCAGEQD